MLGLGKNYQTIRDDHPEETFTRVYTFNSVRKSMSTVIPRPGGGYRLYTKGASEIILNKYVRFFSFWWEFNYRVIFLLGVPLFTVMMAVWKNSRETCKNAY